MSKPTVQPALRIKVMGMGSMHDVIVKWLSGIPESEQQQYVAIDRDFCATPAMPEETIALMGIGKDWIEEHGGDRGWWIVLQTREVANGCPEASP